VVHITGHEVQQLGVLTT